MRRAVWYLLATSQHFRVWRCSLYHGAFCYFLSSQLQLRVWLCATTRVLCHLIERWQWMTRASNWIKVPLGPPRELYITDLYTKGEMRTLKAYRHRSKITTPIGGQYVYLCSEKKWYRITQGWKSCSGAKLVMFKWSLRAENGLDIAKCDFTNRNSLELSSHIIDRSIRTS